MSDCYPHENLSRYARKKSHAFKLESHKHFCCWQSDVILEVAVQPNCHVLSLHYGWDWTQFEVHFVAPWLETVHANRSRSLSRGAAMKR